MKKIIFVLFLVFFLMACTQEKVENNSTNLKEQIKMPSIVIHTIEKPYGLTHTCPNQTIESFVNVKMNNIVSGNLTSFINNTCTGQIRECKGYFDISRELNNKCWVIDCDIINPEKTGNPGFKVHEYLPCNTVEIQNKQNNINFQKQLSWEIIIE